MRGHTCDAKSAVTPVRLWSHLCACGHTCAVTPVRSHLCAVTPVMRKARSHLCACAVTPVMRKARSHQCAVTPVMRKARSHRCACGHTCAPVQSHMCGHTCARSHLCAVIPVRVPELALSFCSCSCCEGVYHFPNPKLSSFKTRSSGYFMSVCVVFCVYVCVCLHVYVCESCV